MCISVMTLVVYMTTSTREPGGAEMRRISSIQTDWEVDLERRREELRDRRWSRRRSKILTATSVFAGAVALQSGMLDPLAGVLRAIARAL
jgi:hypothetical protein